MTWFCGVVVITCHTHWVLGRSPSEICDSLPGIVNAICFNTPQENFGEFAGYKFCVTDSAGFTFFRIGACRKDFCRLGRPC